MLVTNQSIDQFNPHILFICKGTQDKGAPHKLYYHQHDFLELSIVLSGTATYKFANETCILEEGGLLILNPNTHHGELPSPQDNTQLHIGVSNLLIDDLEIKNFLSLGSDSPVFHIKKHRKEFLACCEEIVKERSLCEPGNEFIIKSLVMKLIILLYREKSPVTLQSASNKLDLGLKDKEDVVSAIVDYMDTHYMDDISLEYISKTIYLSTAYISKIFKKEIGTSPINYLIKVRLNKAKELLEEDNLPINIVATQVGYKDAYHFSRLFKKYFGFPPSKLLKDKNA